MKNVFAKIAKIGEEVRSGQPMKVELGELDTVINDIKNHNLSPTLSLVGDGIKLLEKASSNARTQQRSAEIRLDTLEKLIKKGKEFGFDVRDYESFLPMAKAHVQKAGDAAKRIESASSTARLAYD